MPNTITFKAFISRQLDTKSPLLLLPQVEWTHRSMLSFEAVDFETPPSGASLFFYSKTAVRFFFQTLDPSSMRRSDYLYAAMGKGTAAEIEKSGCTCTVVGDATGEGVAQELVKKMTTRDLVFVRGTKSRRTVENHLKTLGFPSTQSLVVYDQKPAPIVLPEFDLYVFTSPLNFDIFFENNYLPEDGVVLAIGDTTRLHIRSKTKKQNIIIPDYPSEESISDKINNVLLSDYKNNPAQP